MSFYVFVFASPPLQRNKLIVLTPVHSPRTPNASSHRTDTSSPMRSVHSSPAASRGGGHLILHPQQPVAVDSRLSTDAALHALLSGRASREGIIPSSCFALHQRDSKASLAFVAHPLAWGSAAASATPAISAAHAHYSASELPLPLHSPHVHRDDDWRMHAYTSHLGGAGAGGLSAGSRAGSRGIVPRFAQPGRIVSVKHANTEQQEPDAIPPAERGLFEAPLVSHFCPVSVCLRASLLCAVCSPSPDVRTIEEQFMASLTR
jgi:hypothetical protein